MDKFGPIAQLVEPPAHNRLVPGSSPGGPIDSKVGCMPQIVNFKSSIPGMVTINQRINECSWQF